MRSRLLARVGGLTFLIGAGSGCKDLDPPPPQPFQLYVRVESDPGRPVDGAVLSRDGKTIATTGADGRATLSLSGAEGAITDVAVRCPDGLQTPVKPLSIRLTRIADKSKAPEYGIACPPTLRKVVVAIRADNGPNLPVMYLSKSVARTDASGAAHFALDVAPGGQFTVTLNTEESPKLKPQNPSKPFTVGQLDELVLFEQKFEAEKPRVYVAPPPKVPKAL